MRPSTKDVVLNFRSPSYWTGVWRRFVKDRIAVACGLLILAILLISVVAYLTVPQPSVSILRRLKPMGTEGYPLGTDELGRNMLVRLIHGARMSLFMGVVPVCLAFVMGSAIGISAGFVGGWTNSIIMRCIDVFYAFPSVLLAIALSGALGSGLTNAIVALTVVFVPPIARIAESSTTQVRSLDYVEAARTSGAHAIAIIRVHVFPNVMAPVFVYATSLISVAMILASGLSFLGLGVKPPTAEWGLMLNTLRTSIYVRPWVAALPGFAIFITSISFNMLSNGIRNAMDIRE